MRFDNVTRALEQMRAGRMVILVDDADRENEGDLVMAADCITPQAVNFMVKYARGLVCLTLTEERLRQLDIPMMVTNNTSAHNTAFTVTIEARHGVSTGISAADRAHTIRTAVDPKSRPEDLARPGHIFPLRARDGGVLVRTGHTEGSVDLARLAGYSSAGVICEIMNDDGSMARTDDLRAFAAQHDMVIVSIAELVEYRLAHETLVQRLTTRTLTHPRWGQLTAHVFATGLDDRQHLALVKGAPQDFTADDDSAKAPLVRVQATQASGDILAAVFGDEQQAYWHGSGKLLAEDHAVLLCLDRGAYASTLAERIAALGQHGAEASPEHSGVLRQLGIGAQILRDLGLGHIRLLSHHAKKFPALEGFGLHVDDVVHLDGEGATDDAHASALTNWHDEQPAAAQPAAATAPSTEKNA